MDSPIERIGKTQYAERIGCSREALRRVLNVELYDALRAVGYRKYQKYLTRRQVELLEELTCGYLGKNLY